MGFIFLIIWDAFWWQYCHELELLVYCSCDLGREIVLLPVKDLVMTVNSRE